MNRSPKYSPDFRPDLRFFDRIGRGCRYVLLVWFGFLCGCLGIGVGPVAAEATIAVLYPDVKEPYRAVFQTIIDGIAAVPQLEVKVYPLEKNFNQEELNHWLQREQVGGSIALGKWGFQASRSIDPSLPVVVGALRIAPGKLSGYSLAVDPDQVFRTLKNLVPATRRIFVVYSPENNGWLMDLAEQAAKKQGLVFRGLPANDLREAMHRYREVLKDMRSEGDAIWLPLDNITVNDDVVLPMLLEAAWTREMVIFSGNLAHVQKGVLLAMYPDYFALGQRLGEMISSYCHSLVAPGVKLASDLQIAVNQRTAAHLGLQFSAQQQRTINLTLPSR